MSASSVEERGGSISNKTVGHRIACSALTYVGSRELRHCNIEIPSG